MNIRGEGTSSFSSFILLEQLHAWDNAADAFSISQAAYAAFVACSAGRNGRHGIVVSSSKHILLNATRTTDISGEKSCGVAIRDNTRDILLENIKVEYATQAGICVRNSTGIVVRGGAIYNELGDENAVCFHVRDTSDFQNDEPTCVIAQGELYDSDGSVVPPTAAPVPVRNVAFQLHPAL